MSISEEDQAFLGFQDARSELVGAMTKFKETAEKDDRDLAEELQEVIDEAYGNYFDL